MYYFSLIQDLGQFCPSFDGTVQTWARKSNLDYLSLDFNSASPSPVQKVCLYSLSILWFLCLCIQEGCELFSFIVLQNSSLWKSVIQIETHRVSACFSLHTETISVWWAQSRLRAGGREEDSSPAKHQNGVDRCSAVKNIIIHIV